VMRSGPSLVNSFGKPVRSSATREREWVTSGDGQCLSCVSVRELVLHARTCTSSLFAFPPQRACLAPPWRLAGDRVKLCAVSFTPLSRRVWPERLQGESP
jgi:hypothetical protein